MKKPSIYLSYTLLLSICCMMFACGSAGTEKGEAESPLRIGLLKGPTAMSMIPLVDRGSGLNLPGFREVEFILKPSPPHLRALLLQQELDMAVIPTTLAAILYNKGVPYQAAAVTIWGTLALVGSEKSTNGEIKTWKDLENREIYLMGKGMTPDILFRCLLEKKGLSPGQAVELKYNFPDPMDLAQAIAAGRAPLGVISEPMTTLVKKKNPAVATLMDLTQQWEQTWKGEIPLAQTVLVVRKNFAQQHPETVKQFLNLYREAIDEVNKNPIRAGQLIAKHGILPDAETAARAIPGCHIRFQEVYPIKDKITAYLDIFYRFNPATVGGKLPDEAFYFRQ